MNDAPESEGLVYQYRPRMVGSELAFRLGEQSLEWSVAGSRGSVTYPMIARVRLGYRPSNLGNRRFIAEIWPLNGPRLEVASASYRSLVAMDDQGPAYNAFVGELHRRIAEAGGDCRFEAGFAAWRWWPMVVVGIVTAAGLLYVAIQTLLRDDLGAGVLIAAFIALFAWQMGPLIVRNRPRDYEPNHIPADVLPAG